MLLESIVGVLFTVLGYLCRNLLGSSGFGVCFVCIAGGPICSNICGMHKPIEGLCARFVLYISVDQKSAGLLSVFLLFDFCCFVLWGWVWLVVPRPMFGVVGLVGFLVWAVFWFVLGWGGGFCPRALCWLYVGWDGMRMGRYIVGKEQIAR